VKENAEEIEIDLNTEFTTEEVEEMSEEQLLKSIELVRLQINELEDELGEDAYDEG
jgi:hypothetical protein